ncbi:MAG TPA: FecR domain-containing protein [Chitinispirillaceae bacterium]|nr:FecR domain-containing protein [Chitinispirillaceae bacterium]
MSKLMISGEKSRKNLNAPFFKRPLHTGILFIAVVFPALIVFAQSQNVKDGYIHHTVKKGESISLLCIQYYGYYSENLGKALQKDNSTLKKIDLIIPGQQLLFKEPAVKAVVSGRQDSPAKTDTESAGRDTVFMTRIDLSQGVVTYLEGSSFLKRSGNDNAVPLAVNTALFPGDRIETSSNGRVEILVNRESVVRMKENSILELDSLRNISKGKGKTRFNFPFGSVWTKVKKFKDSFSRFELELPTAVAGVHGTVYQTSVQKDSSSDVAVFEGEVAVSGIPAVTQVFRVIPIVLNAQKAD